MDFKSNRTKVVIGVIVLIIILIAPLGVYVYNFQNNELSTSPSDWGVFGDYIGGITNSILSLIAITVSLLSLFFVNKIQERIHYKEMEFSEQQSLRSQELIYAQSKPFPFLDLSNFSHEIKINLQNMGVGTMDITNIKIISNKDELSNFRDLFNSYSTFTQPSCLEIFFNTAPTHVLAPSTSKELLKIVPNDKITTTDIITSKEMNQFRSILKDYKIDIIYKDIFGNEFHYEKDLRFLGNLY